MFKKLAFLAALATVGFTQDTFPMPVVPNDFVAASYHYLYQDSKLTPLNTWSIQIWSSELNKMFDMEGTISEDGNKSI